MFDWSVKDKSDLTVAFGKEEELSTAISRSVTSRAWHRAQIASISQNGKEIWNSNLGKLLTNRETSD